MKKIIISTVVGLIASTNVWANISEKQLFEYLLPQYIAWAHQIEDKGLQSGTPLDESGIELAKDIGIKAPENVRVIYVDSVPYPYENPALKEMGLSLGFIGEGIVNNAQVFGYSIYVRKGYELDRPRLAHELVHVLQIERSNLNDVVMQHISDLAQYGYQNAPLEVEAFEANKKYAER
ncbi:hypothetical protein OE749_16655 [Aestuariibacter sp. AA17]|uniref:DUF4157 domain-containing protein n=1 Tax=Fluctibacter corallii TaxID=2984329 RepID=A0ABT3ADD8_9ALTE|nr:hypothetical protein [Aestuariibacter sp. AA17]MCV2886327.1 hypothetical protein [Aestuariibacter sp. AA17]